MAINFDSLPTSKPVVVIPKGRYIGIIEDAEMKQPKDLSKPEYLNIKYSIYDNNNKKVGTMFDMLFDNDAALLQYKLKRFIEAIELDLTGSFELKDLSKIIKGKKIILDINIDSKEGYPDKSIVDLFSGDIYYPIAEAKELFEDYSEASVDSLEVASTTEEATATDSEDDEKLEF